jgi:hypothetical protein
MSFTISKAGLERLKELVAQQADEELLASVVGQHPADVAEVLDQLERGDARYCL